MRWKGSGLDYDTIPVPMDSVLGGPNKGVRFVVHKLEWALPVSIYSPNIYGTTTWASLQDGSQPTVGGYDHCDRFSTPTLFTSLATAVKKHEGSVAGASSHFDIYKSKADDSPMVNIARQLQRAWYREWSTPPTFGSWTDVLLRKWS